MSYESVDKLQNHLAESVFNYAEDRKKASGRALGTLVEIITYYTLCAWGLRDALAIERRIPEYANDDITHNVEFSLHPILAQQTVTLGDEKLPITPKKLRDAITGSLLSKTKLSSRQVLSTDQVIRNACLVGEGNSRLVTANLVERNADLSTIILVELSDTPFAVFECKRVGVEEGMKKGPQTIEKAKQGAYVAQMVSSLQKYRLNNGSVRGIIDLGDGKTRTGEYDELLREILVDSDHDALARFILTVGIVSNHGNWFTAETQNKEMKVLAQAYDRLLFLTDAGLSRFIEKLLLNPIAELKPAGEAFRASYAKADDQVGRKKAKNRFTKVTMDVGADAALKQYFAAHEDEVESWFNVIAPAGSSITDLRDNLRDLSNKPWKEIRQL